MSCCQQLNQNLRRQGSGTGSSTDDFNGQPGLKLYSRWQIQNVSTEQQSKCKKGLYGKLIAVCKAALELMVLGRSEGLER